MSEIFKQASNKSREIKTENTLNPNFNQLYSGKKLASDKAAELAQEALHGYDRLQEKVNENKNIQSSNETTSQQTANSLFPYAQVSNPETKDLLKKVKQVITLGEEICEGGVKILYDLEYRQEEGKYAFAFRIYPNESYALYFQSVDTSGKGKDNLPKGLQFNIYDSGYTLIVSTVAGVQDIFIELNGYRAEPGEEFYIQIVGVEVYPGQANPNYKIFKGIAGKELVEITEQPK